MCTRLIEMPTVAGLSWRQKLMVMEMLERNLLQ